MASIGERSSSSTPTGKPVVVRVKRKSYHSPLDAFWLEINETPTKRAHLDLQKLSISDDSVHRTVEELKTTKVLVHHIETVNSDATIDVLQSFLPSYADVIEGVPKSEERKQSFKKDSKQERLLSKARQSQEISAQNARFKQIWRSRRGDKEASQDKALYDMCHFYDVVRVDVEGRSIEVQEQDVISLEDQRILASYLPLLREFIPSAAADIESDICEYMSKPASADDYVYDYYTVRDDMDMDDETSLSPFPLVQVEDEDFYDGPDDESECESEDSNAEHHPRNDYPDETSDEEEEDDDEEDIETLSNESEAEGAEKSSRSSESEWLRGLSKDAVPSCEAEMHYDDDRGTFDHVCGDNFEYDNDDDRRR